MPKSVSLDDYMAKNLIKVKANDTVLNAAKVIINNQVSGVCVVDDNDKLVGIISELDCLRAIVERIYQHEQPNAGYVYEAMTKDVITSRPEEDIISVADSMLRQKHRRRPIVDGEDLIGQVTCRQLLSAIKNFS